MQNPSKPPIPPREPPQPPVPNGPAEGPPPENAAGERSWFSTHGRDLRFLILFAVFMAIYYVVSTTAVMKDRFFPWYLRFNADASVGVLHTFGYDDVERDETYMKSSRGSISVARGCDAAAPTALFAAAVLASPVSTLSKLPAVVIGSLILAVVNVIRIITLFLSAAHWREAFDILHLEVWQAAFIVLSLALWLLWVAQATRRQRRRVHV